MGSKLHQTVDQLDATPAGVPSFDDLSEKCTPLHPAFQPEDTFQTTLEAIERQIAHVEIRDGYDVMDQFSDHFLPWMPLPKLRSLSNHLRAGRLATALVIIWDAGLDHGFLSGMKEMKSESDFASIGGDPILLHRPRISMILAWARHHKIKRAVLRKAFLGGGRFYLQGMPCSVSLPALTNATVNGLLREWKFKSSAGRPRK